MAKFILYLLEASAVLAFFYLIYILILRRETFFSLNRFFLIGSLAFSLLFPLLSFDFISEKVVAVEQPIEEISKFRMSYYEAMALWEFNAYRSSEAGRQEELQSLSLATQTDWAKLFISICLILYAIGVVICLSRTIWTLRWIWKMIAVHPHEKIDGVHVIKLPQPIAPFSFLKYVFVFDAQVGTPEFNQILAHEKTHIRQKHSIDLIFVQLLAAFLWFNPVIWQLIKSLKATHEYIADKKIINSGYSLVEYQTLLLRQLISNNSYGLVHNFNLSFIKKRITMMKNKKSGWSGKVKVAMAIACTVVFSLLIVQCNSKLEEQVPDATEVISKYNLTANVSLPVLPETKNTFKGDLSNSLNLTILENKLTIDGEAYELDEMGAVLEKGADSQPLIIVMEIDKNQPMKFIREVHMELRKANQRKMVYIGQTIGGEKVKTALLLPPLPSDEYQENGPSIEEMYAAGLDLLKIELGDNAGAANQEKVYDFVVSHMKRQTSNYVVSARYNDEDTFNDYLVNLIYIQEGFNQLYQERAQKLFGKDYHEIDKEEYKAVREGVPMAISIADRSEDLVDRQ